MKNLIIGGTYKVNGGKFDGMEVEVLRQSCYGIAAVYCGGLEFSIDVQYLYNEPVRV